MNTNKQAAGAVQGTQAAFVIEHRDFAGTGQATQQHNTMTNSVTPVLDDTALQDMTPSAAMDAMHLTVEESATARAHLRAGRLESALDACQRAQKAIDAALITLTYLSGGLPR